MGASYIISCADNEMSTNEELPDTPGGMDGNENHKKILQSSKIIKDSKQIINLRISNENEIYPDW